MNLTSEQIKQHALSLGFHKVGIAAVDDNASGASDRLKAWLELGYHADMQWMDNPKRFDVHSIMPDVKSIICVALNYYTGHQRPPSADYGKIARYAWGRDYHRVMHRRLKQLNSWLQTEVEGIQTRYYADTGPIQDKFWAQQAGIGWIAKNSNVITREYGSWVFLGEILTNLQLDGDRPHTQHCGTCTRCLEACPTEAIREPFVVDANRCIAYHTIENRSRELPDPIKSKLDGWVAGCDICQDVCPWNGRFAQATDVAELQPYRENLKPKLSDLVEINEAEWDQRFRASALRRIKPYMWQRNARANVEI